MKNLIPNSLMILSLLAVLASVYMNLWAEDKYREKSLTIAEWKENSDNVKMVSEELSEIKKLIEAKDVIDSSKLDLIKLSTRVENLESLFLNKSEILITLPLLKKDVELYEGKIESLSSSLSTTNNLVLGLLAAILAQLAAVAFLLREK
jgi:hypothetical protein